MAKVNKKNDAKSEVTLFNKEKVDFLTRINFDADMVSLTDLWKEAGSVREKAPNFWLNQDATKDFVEMATSMLNATQNCIIKSKRGKGGGTYAHKNIALAYAKYLDARLHIMVNEVFFQRIEEEKNPDLIGDRYIEAYRKRGKSNKWIKARLDGKIKRKEFTSCLAKHGVESPQGFRKCTNAIYEPLYGDGGTVTIREKKNLPDTAKIRDNMSELELSAVDFAETLARHNIEAKNINGENRCRMECQNSSRIVAKAIIDSRKSIGVF